MAMMARPKVLIADEPTTALDVATQTQILELLRDLARQQNTAILFITHDLGIAAAFADRLMVLHGGRLMEIGAAGSSRPRSRPTPTPRGCWPRVSALSPTGSVHCPRFPSPRRRSKWLGTAAIMRRGVR